VVAAVGLFPNPNEIGENRDPQGVVIHAMYSQHGSGGDPQRHDKLWGRRVTGDLSEVADDFVMDCHLDLPTKDLGYRDHQQRSGSEPIQMAAFDTDKPEVDTMKGQAHLVRQQVTEVVEPFFGLVPHCPSSFVVSGEGRTR
jgi:hypothetical protein